MIKKSNVKTWEELILEGIKIGEDVSTILTKAAEAAPPEIKKILTNLPDNILFLNKKTMKNLKMDRKEIIIYLFWYYWLLADEGLLKKVALNIQKDTCTLEAEAANSAAFLASMLKEKEIKAEYLFRAGDALYDLRKFSAAEKVYTKTLALYRELEKETSTYVPDLAMVLNSLGLLYKDIEKFELAEKMCNESLTLYRKLTKKDSTYIPFVIMVLNNTGLIYCDINKFSQAKQAYIEALEKCKPLKKSPQRWNYTSTLLNNMGLVYYNTHKFSKAETAYQKALAIRKKLAQKNETYIPDVVDTLNNLGDLYRDLKKYPQSEKAYTKALAIHKKLKSKKSFIYTSKYGILLNSLANLYYETERISQAENLYRKALEIAKRLAQTDNSYYLDAAGTAANLGNIYMDTNRLSDAEEAYQEFLKMLHKLKIIPDEYKSDEAEVFNILASIYNKTHKFLKAREMYAKSLSLYQELAEKYPDYKKDVAKLLNNTGVLYYDLKKYSQSEKTITKALQMYKKGARTSQNDADISMCLHNMGNIYYYTHRFSKAETAYQKALAIRKKLAQKNETYIPDVADTLNNLGNLYSDLGKFSQAEQAHTEALNTRTLLSQKDKAYFPDVAETLTNLGNLYFYTEDFRKSEDMYSKTFTLYNTLAEKNPLYTLDVGMALNNLGNFYYDTENFYKAKEMYRKALTIFKTMAKKTPSAYELLVAGAFNNLGLVYSQMGKISKAKKAHYKALNIRKKRLNLFELSETFLSLSLLKDGEPDKAVRALELGILFSEEKTYKYAQKSKEEGIYLNFLEKTDDPYYILGTLETLRDPDLLSLEWDLKENETKKTPQVVEKLLKKKVPPLHIDEKFPDNTLIFYIQHIRNNILYFAVTQKEKHIFKSGYEFVNIGHKLQINLTMQKLVREYKKNADNIITKCDSLLCEWTHSLPLKIQTLLSEKEIIVFSPDAACSYFPLEGLMVNGEPVCFSKTVVRATGMHQLQNIVSHPADIDSSLIVGNPWPEKSKNRYVYQHPEPVGPLKCLDNAEKEAVKLAKKFVNPHILTGKEATADVFLKELSQHDIIHFAGHGKIGRILFFAGPNKRSPPLFEPKEFLRLRKAWRSDNGTPIYMMDEWDFVTDLDILETSLKKGALVFLSACQTGKHVYAGGGHFQGLARAFLKSGASNVVSSLVPLFDAPARDFAFSFYDQLLSGNSVIEALRETRRKIKEKYTLHISWLPYIHYGCP